MTDQNQSPMGCLLDAEDELVSARNLVELIGMTTRHQPDDDAKAIAAGVEAALARFDACQELLVAAKAGFSANAPQKVAA